MNYNGEIREICERVARQLGMGHTEKIYQEAFSVELRQRGYRVELERVLPILYRVEGNNGYNDVAVGYARLDILAFPPNEQDPFVIELKAAASYAEGSLRAQIQVYLRALQDQYRGISGYGIQFMQPGAAAANANIVHMVFEPYARLIANPVVRPADQELIIHG
jgi:GxxExxY protein